MLNPSGGVAQSVGAPNSNRETGSLMPTVDARTGYIAVVSLKKTLDPIIRTSGNPAQWI